MGWPVGIAYDSYHAQAMSLTREHFIASYLLHSCLPARPHPLAISQGQCLTIVEGML